MTTLYRPVRIESAAQAEALPIGTVSVSDHPEDHPAAKVTPTLWVCVWDVDDDHDATYSVAPNSHMLGMTALVPIEAEEETLERQRFSQAVPDVLHRYTTPWTLYTPQEPK